MLLELLNIMTNDATADNIETQMTKNSMSLRLKQKQSAAKISDIHAKFDVEKQAIRSEINSLDDEASSNEYENLMSELNELKAEEEQAVEIEEQASNDYETRIQLENDNLGSRLEAIKADNESLKEMHQQEIEKSFGYFK